MVTRKEHKIIIKKIIITKLPKIITNVNSRVFAVLDGFMS